MFQLLSVKSLSYFYLSLFDATIFYQPSKCATQRPYSAPTLRLFHLREPKQEKALSHWRQMASLCLGIGGQAAPLRCAHLIMLTLTFSSKSFSNENQTITIVSEHRCVSGVNLKARRQCTLKVKVPRPACPNSSYSLSRRNSDSHALFMEFTLPLQDMRFPSLNQNVSTIVHAWSHFQGGPLLHKYYLYLLLIHILTGSS